MPHRLSRQPDAAMPIAACITPTGLSVLFRGEYNNNISMAQSATNVGKQVLPTLLVYTIPWHGSLAQGVQALSIADIRSGGCARIAIELLPSVPFIHLGNPLADIV